MPHTVTTRMAITVLPHKTNKSCELIDSRKTIANIANNALFITFKDANNLESYWRRTVKKLKRLKT